MSFIKICKCGSLASWNSYFGGYYCHNCGLILEDGLPDGGRGGHMKHSVEIKIDPIDLRDVCPYCFGTGRVKAMQSYATYNGMSIRGPDTTEKCTACNGTGRRTPDGH